MKYFLLPLMTLSVLTNACSQPVASQAISDPFADVAVLMERAKVPGLTLATLSDCMLEEVRYFGVEDVETGDAVDSDTVFEAASLTKTMFAAIVMQLADEGVIDIDEPLAERFDYPRIVDQDAYKILTPRIILQHRSGFANWESDPGDPETWSDINFKNAPDTKFGYSGEAFQLLQAYVEDRTGQSLDVLFQERLGELLTLTSLSGAPDYASPAFGHDKNGAKEGGRTLRNHGRSVAASSAVTTALDYARFVGYLCNGAGVSEGMLAEFLKPQSPTDNDAVSWALGWGVQAINDGQIYFHWGDNGAFKAFTAFNRETGDGVVYFANASNGLKLIDHVAEPTVGDVASIVSWLDYGVIE